MPTHSSSAIYGGGGTLFDKNRIKEFMGRNNTHTKNALLGFFTFLEKKIVHLLDVVARSLLVVEEKVTCKICGEIIALQLCIRTVFRKNHSSSRYYEKTKKVRKF